MQGERDEIWPALPPLQPNHHESDRLLDSCISEADCREREAGIGRRAQAGAHGNDPACGKRSAGPQSANPRVPAIAELDGVRQQPDIAGSQPPVVRQIGRRRVDAEPERYAV